jgi:transposase-like protein
MPLPALNTGGVDVSNTIAQIDKMRTGELQRQNLQSEIDTRTASAPLLNQERQSMNAFRILETKKAQQALDESKRQSAREQEKDAVKSILGVKDHPNPMEAYDEVLAKHPTAPKKSYFTTVDDNGQVVWDTKTYNKFADGTRDAIELAHNPELKGEFVKVINPQYDPSKEISADNPKLVKIHLVRGADKQLTMDEGYPPEAVVDDIGKEKQAEELARKADTRAEQIRVATDKYHKDMLKKDTDRDAATAAYRKEVLKITKKKSEADPVKETLKSATGDMLRQLRSGKVEVLGLDEDGEPAWKEATPAQTKNFTSPGGPAKKGGLMSGLVKGEGTAKLPPEQVSSLRVQAKAAAAPSSGSKLTPVQVAAKFKEMTGEDL